MGTVDANTGDYITWRLDESDFSQVPTKIVSSASLAGLFIPQHIDGTVDIDGGTYNGLDAVSAVERCMELVDDYSQVTLDIILLDRFDKPDQWTDIETTLGNFSRKHQLKSYYSGLKNVIEVMVTYPEINYRFLMEPTGPYPVFLRLLDFSNRNTWPMQENGREDSQTALAYGPGFGYDRLFTAIQNNKHKLAEF